MPEPSYRGNGQHPRRHSRPSVESTIRKAVRQANGNSEAVQRDVRAEGSMSKLEEALALQH